MEKLSGPIRHATTAFLGAHACEGTLSLHQVNAADHASRPFHKLLWNVERLRFVVYGRLIHGLDKTVRVFGCEWILFSVPILTFDWFTHARYLAAYERLLVHLIHLDNALTADI